MDPHYQFGLLEVFRATSQCCHGLEADKLVHKLEVNPADRSEISLGKKKETSGALLYFLTSLKTLHKIGSEKSKTNGY